MELQMKKIEDLIKKILDEAKKIEAQRDALDIRMERNERKAGKICYRLYKDFVKNNWDTLNKNTDYYRLFFNSELVVERLVFDTKYEKYALFHPVKNPNMNIYMYIDVTEEEYEVGKVIIDKDQLNWFSERFKITFL